MPRLNLRRPSRFFEGGSVHVKARPWREHPPRGGPIDHNPSQTPVDFDFGMTLDYPRPYCHGETNGLGWPLLSGTDPVYANRPINTAHLQSYARFPLVQLLDYPFMQFRPDIADAMKAFNPNCHIIWWYTLTQVIEAYGDLNALWRKQWEAATSPLDLRLYRPDGTTFPNNLTPGTGVCFVDIGVCRDQLIANLEAAGAGLTGSADGFHIDFCDGQLNAQAGIDLDITRTQWSTLAQLNASLKGGVDAVVGYMNGTRGGAKVVFPNGTTDGGNNGTSCDLWAGRLFEGFEGNPWAHTSFGFAGFDAMMANPIFNRWQGAGVDGGGTALIKAVESSRSGTTYLYSATYNRLARYALGVACLVGGYACCNADTPGAYSEPDPPPYAPDRWADEFSVTAGAHDTTHAGCGWLGRPIEVAAKHASGIWVRRFQRGIVLVNGNNSGSLNITLEKPYKRIQGLRDTTANNGATVSTQTVPGWDARFLLTI